MRILQLSHQIGILLPRKEGGHGLYRAGSPADIQKSSDPKILSFISGKAAVVI